MLGRVILFTLQDKDACVVALAYKIVSYKFWAGIMNFLTPKPAFSSHLVAKSRLFVHKSTYPIIFLFWKSFDKYPK